MVGRCPRFGRVNLLSKKNNLLAVTFSKVFFPHYVWSSIYTYFLLLRYHWFSNRIMTMDAKAWYSDSWTIRIKVTILGKAGIFSGGYSVSPLGYSDSRMQEEITLLYWVCSGTDIAVKLPLLNINRIRILLFIKYIINTLQFLPVYKATSVCKT